VSAQRADGAARLGVVDWGIGGLGLVGMLDHAAPALPITYWSDTGAPPYGLVRTADLVRRLRMIVDRLAGEGCTEVVLACNAASTVVDRLGPTAVPVEGIITHGIAAVPPAAEGMVGVVGGRRLVASGAYRRGLASPRRLIRSRVAQPLSAHIEAGRTGSPEFATDLARITRPLRGASAVVLACTHYPAAARHFADQLPGTTLVDPAAHLAASIAERHRSTSGSAAAERVVLTSGDPGAMRAGAEAAWGMAVAARRATL